MVTSLLLSISVLMFILGGVTFFIYKSKKRTIYFVWTIATVVGGAYFLFGTLVFHFSPSLLPVVPVLGLIVTATELIVIRKTLVATGAPSPKVTKAARPGISAEPGESYLIEGEKPTRAFELLKQLSARGTSSLCMTSLPPAQVKKRYGLEKTKIIWLSKQEVENVISPGDLDILRDTIEEFTKREKGGAVMLDGVEQLIATNGFDLTLKFLYDVCESIALRHAVFLISLDPRAVESKQLATLEQRMIVEK